MNTRLLVFDWDGTLMDSEFHIVSCMKAAICELDLPDRKEDEIKNIIGLGLMKAVQTLYPEQASEAFAHKLADAYRSYYFSDDAPQQLFPGAVETLEHLIDRGFLLAIATGKSRKGLDLSLEHTGLVEMFQISRCADETTSKPHPRMLNEIMTELACGQEETIMIGDTEYDMEMAYNAGTKAIAVSYGVHETQRLLKYKPAGCIDKITDLSGLLASFSDKSI
ncbi:MAG: HAD-IA family hydrolase [Gammaproteobacteria bacterium]|nr:HAD-IA family hydrolase [Gammaproteobacteria bacterium]MCK5092797.1 HAD-IA family hydrolase [Gammaproteobacteria bacterium]